MSHNGVAIARAIAHSDGKSRAIYGGVGGIRWQAVDKEGKVIAAEGDSADRDTVALVPTRSGCSCADSYDVGAGDCDDGEAVYSGCMATACDGDSTTDEDGTVWPSWCHTGEGECAGNNGANWDYCDPATGAKCECHRAPHPTCHRCRLAYC